MTITSIDTNKCVGCKTCVEGCTLDVLRMNNGKATIAYQKDCMNCHICSIFCPAEAITIDNMEWCNKPYGGWG